MVARQLQGAASSTAAGLTKLIEHAACQVTFGICGDYLGRKKIYLVTLILMIACTIGQCFAATPFKGVGYAFD